MSLTRNAFKRLHYPVDIIAQCVRWYLAYSLSLRNLEEIMSERGIVVEHSTLHRWVIRLVPLLENVAIGSSRRHAGTAVLQGAGFTGRQGTGKGHRRQPAHAADVLILCGVQRRGGACATASSLEKSSIS